MAAKKTTTEFRIPGRVATTGPRPASVTQPAASQTDTKGPQPVILTLPLPEPVEDFSVRRIDVRISLKAATGLRRLRLGLDAAGAMRANGRRIDPNSVRDAIEFLLEAIADAGAER